MFGGRINNWFDDKTWEYDGENWVSFPSHPAGPKGTMGGAMCFDSTRRKIVMFGGYNSSGYDTDTWEREGTDWKRIHFNERDRPRPAVTFFNMAYDKKRRRAVYFSGDNSSVYQLNYRTWEYYEKIPTPTPTPDPRSITIRLWMNDTNFSPGDLCMSTVTVDNDTGQSLNGYRLYVVLDIYGTYFFAPSLGTEVDSFSNDYPVFDPGETVITLLPAFTWPYNRLEALNALWMAALIDPDNGSVITGWDTWRFTWTD